ncbi:MAG: hypothetical protein IPJ41_04285 [Phycisphaerales bacterium]|nr:hypothetical protein [Phycisphaerales bacterium]
MYVVRFDRDGNVVWARTYGNTGRDVGYSIVTLPDGSFAVGCQTDAAGGGWTTGLLRLDPAGNPIAAWAYPGTAGSDPVNVPDPGVSMDYDRASNTLVFTSNYQSLPTFHRADAAVGAPIVSQQYAFGLAGYNVQVGFTDVVPDPTGAADALISGTIRRTDNGNGAAFVEPFFMRVDFNGNPVAPAIGYNLNPGANPAWAGTGAAITTNGVQAFMTGRIEIPAGSTDPALNILALDLFGAPAGNFFIDLPGGNSIEPAYRAADFRANGGPLYIAGHVLDQSGLPRAMQAAVPAIMAVDFLKMYDDDTQGRSIVAMDIGCGQAIAGAADPASPPPGFGAGDGYLIKSNEKGVTGCREKDPDFVPKQYPLKPYAVNPDPISMPAPKAWPITFTDIPTKDLAHCFSPACTPCIADWNGDGIVNTLDVLAFLNDWVAHAPKADVNGDGTVNTLDVLLFLNAWASGC